MAELIGTIIFVFIAKATGFALAAGTQEVRKRKNFSFNCKLSKLHVLQIWQTLEIAHFANKLCKLLTIADEGENSLG